MVRVVHLPLPVYEYNAAISFVMFNALGHEEQRGRKKKSILRYDSIGPVGGKTAAVNEKRWDQ